MSRFLPKPRGLWRLDREFPPRWANLPEAPVMVSLCGAELPWHGIVLEADPGRDYDWSRLAAFYAQILVRPGIDATRAVKALMPLVAPCLQVIDLAHWRCWNLVSLTPRVRSFESRMPERPEGWR